MVNNLIKIRLLESIPLKANHPIINYELSNEKKN